MKTIGQAVQQITREPVTFETATIAQVDVLSTDVNGVTQSIAPDVVVNIHGLGGLQRIELSPSLVDSDYIAVGNQILVAKARDRYIGVAVMPITARRLGGGQSQGTGRGLAGVPSPQQVNVRQSGAQAEVSWAPVPGAVGYEIWQSPTPDMDDDDAVVVAHTTNTYWTSGAGGSFYAPNLYYAIVARTRDNQTSVVSDWVQPVVYGSALNGILSQDQVTAFGGSVVTAKASSITRADFTSLDSPQTFEIDIADPLGSHPTTAPYDTNDLLQFTDTSGHELWVKVAAAKDKKTFWRYTVTKQSPSAGTNYTIKSGSVVVNYGQSGQGFLYQSADDANAPFYSVRTHTGTPYSSYTERARLGSLSGITDEAFGSLSGYGLYTDNGYFTGQVIAANGSRAGYGYAIGDPLMVCHYDGPRPFETDYSGNLNGHKGQVGTAAGGVIFRPGTLNGKAVQIAEATTNLVTNPSFETGIWATEVGAGGTATQDSGAAHFGAYSLKLVCAGSTYGRQLNVSGLTPGATYTLSGWIYVPSWSGGNINLDIIENLVIDTSGIRLSATNGGWTRYSETFTYPAGGSGTAAIRFFGSATPTFTAYLDGVQIEQKAYATPYADGSLGSGHSWSGTAHASTSSRTAASLYYDDATNINATVGTLAAWVYLDNWNVADDRYIANINTTGNNAFQLWQWNGDKKIYAGFIDGGGTSRRAAYDVSGLATGWHHIAVTWSATAGQIYLYVDGALVGSYTTASWTPITHATDLYIGSDSAGANQWNGCIDDLVVTDFVLSAVEVKALFLSYAPVIAETGPQEFLLTGAGTGSVKGNSRGFFGMDAAGGAAFGLVTTDGVNASYWGGASETFDAGDSMQGSNASGKINTRFDASAGTYAIRRGTSNIMLFDGNGDTVTLDNLNPSPASIFYLTHTGSLDTASYASMQFDASSPTKFLRLGVYDGSNTHNWTFDSDMKLTVPSSGVISQIGTSTGSLTASAGNNNNVSTSGVSTVLCTNSPGDFTITGFANGYEGKFLTFIYTGTNKVTISDSDANSSAGNRIVTSNATSVTSTGVCYFLFQYVSSRWRLLTSSL